MQVSFESAFTGIAIRRSVPRKKYDREVNSTTNTNTQLPPPTYVSGYMYGQHTYIILVKSFIPRIFHILG